MGIRLACLLLLLPWSAAAQGQPDAVEVDRFVPINLHGTIRSVAVFRFSMEDTQQRYFYGPLFLLATEPGGGDVFVEQHFSQGQERNLNRITLYVVLGHPSVEASVREATKLAPDVSLMRQIMTSLRPALELPGTDRWVTGVTSTPGATAVFGDLIRIHFNLAPDATQSVKAALRKGELRLRFTYRAVTPLAPSALLAKRTKYTFPEKTLQDVFRDRKVVFFTQAQLAGLLAQARTDIEIAGIAGSIEDLGSLLRRIPLDALGGTTTPVVNVAPKDISPAGSEKNDVDLLVGKYRSGVSLSPEERASLRQINLIRLTREDLGRVFETIVSLAEQAGEPLWYVAERNSAEDRVRVDDLLVNMNPDYLHLSYDADVERRPALRQFSVFNGSLRIRIRQNNTLDVRHVATGRKFVQELSARENFRGYSESPGENCVKIFTADPLPNIINTYCIDRTHPSLTYQRLRWFNTSREAILTPSHLQIQDERHVLKKVLQYPALPGQTFQKLTVDPEEPDQPIIILSNRKRLKVPA